MSVQSEINRIKTAVSDAYTAVAGKNGEMPASKTVGNLAESINSIVNDEVWLPSVDASGNISWTKSTSSTPPTTRNIKGDTGSTGPAGKTAYASAQDGGYTGTEAQFNTDLAAVSRKADARLIKTTMDAVATANTEYYLGTKTAVSITLPSTASAGQLISVVFYSGATAATLSISGSTIGEVIVPAANQRVEVNMLYDGLYWAIVSNTMALPSIEE